MVRCSLFIASIFGISLIICVTGIQSGDGSGLFGISTMEISKDEPELLPALRHETFFQENDERCSSDSDCLYGGKCTDKGTCSCPEGTNGTLCENVIECMKHPQMCGNGTDVKCVFHAKSKYAFCQCTENNKWFNNFAERCAEPCKYLDKNEEVKKDCGLYGKCTNQFCWCVKGVSGDFCEKIDQCAEIDCGSDPTTTCKLGIDGAFCKCNKTYQVFDKTEKICKGVPCKNDSSNCMFDGNCTDDGTCLCRKGVGGPLCEQVYECEEKPDMCGKGTDVKCTFSTSLKKAVCMCDDKEKSYDVVEKKCKKPCEKDEECGLFGRCDRKGFCRCLEGVSGDKCEIIEKCIHFDCGVRTKCTLGSDGEARCVCPDPHLGFDYESKTCKDCECGDNSKSCEFRDGEKKCECALNYYRNGEKCEACNCGKLSLGCELRDGKKECFCPLNYTTIGDTCQKCSCGIGSYHCRKKDGKAECLCYGPYKQKIDKCEFCDCGVHEGECSYTDTGKKQCICKPGFKMLEETGFCTQVCNATNKCQNGGLCADELCKCREDYTGGWCETPKWCLHNRCGHHFNQDDVDCIWDKTKREGRCQCKDPLSFYRDDRTCDKCDCGPNGYCILTERGEKVCICKEGYADYLLTCKRCNCGTESINCTLNYRGNPLCQCNEYYKQKEDGPSATCARCDCGKHGTCEFGGESKAQKVCHCEENYKVYNGGCEECNCGPHGFCSFDSNGHKVCTCDYGYSVLNGRCESCDCEPLSIRGIGSSCIFNKSVKQCRCPEGYESPQNKFCEDINECLNPTACPENTNCVNLPGSYSCQCKKGFKVISLDHDPKKSGCKDIDECVEKPCTSNTVCVNTPGSFDCKCKEDYYPTSSTSGPYYNPRYATCNKKETQWRGASIALGVILSLGILGVGGYIFYLKKGFNFRR